MKRGEKRKKREKMLLLLSRCDCAC